MSFNLEHDWQGNMATPKTKLGEKTKLHLFLILSTLWIFTGLIGHPPWVTAESQTISMIMDIIQNNSIIAPLAANQTSINNPPLYPYIGATLGKLFSGLLPIHDAARLSNALWVGLTLLSLGMLTRELWGSEYGRQAGLIFIASIGLIFNIHTIRPEIAALLGFSLSLYAFALHNRRPFRASIILGIGTSIIFLSNGIIPLISILITALGLLSIKIWRNKRYYIFCLISVIIASIIIGPWIFILSQYNPELFFSWINRLNFLQGPEFIYYLKNILWFTWPSLPLLILVLFKNYKILSQQKKFHLPIIFSISIFITIAFDNKLDQINLMPILIPFSVIAIGGIDLLKRSAASALNWFGILIFGLIGLLIWLVWFSMISGFPAKLYERIFYLSGNYPAEFQVISFLIALTASTLWLTSIINLKITNRSAISNWALGITMVWITLIMLCSPFLDNRKSYRNVFLDAKKHLTQSSSCLYIYNLSENHINLLHYYTGIRGINSNNQNVSCRMVLLSLHNEDKMPSEYQSWKQVWTGKRIERDKNHFILLNK
ncbi:MAG: glycosyl transferase [Methylophilaceae bacterium]